jgi:protein TonB
MAANGTIVLSRSLWPDPAGARRPPRFTGTAAAAPSAAAPGRPRLRADSPPKSRAQGIAGLASAGAHAALLALALFFWSRVVLVPPPPSEESVPLVFVPAAAPPEPAAAAPPPEPAPPEPVQAAAPPEPPPPAPTPLPEPAPVPLQAEPPPPPAPAAEAPPKPPPPKPVPRAPRERAPAHPSRVASVPRPAATAPATATTPGPAAPTALATAAPLQPARLPGGMAQSCRPEYPRAALRDQVQGLVVMRVRVTPEGRAAEVEVAQGSGSDLLDKAAVAALRTCRFEPATQAGRAVAFSYEVPYRFRLEN